MPSNTRWTAEQYKKHLEKNQLSPKHNEKVGRVGKYNNVKTEIDGFMFDSKKEANRYVELKGMVNRGEIRDLQRQVKYRLDVNGVKVCGYIADFVYKKKSGEEIIEDVKGVRTDVYRLKKKLMYAIHGIEIREV